MKKKTGYWILFICCVTFFSCGPSAEEKAKMEQARIDSMKAAEDMMRAAEAAAAAQVIDSSMITAGDSIK